MYYTRNSERVQKLRHGVRHQQQPQQRPAFASATTPQLHAQPQYLPYSISYPAFDRRPVYQPYCAWNPPQPILQQHYKPARPAVDLNKKPDKVEQQICKKRKDKYPILLILIYSLLMVIIGIALLILQIILIDRASTDRFYNIGAGIWVGAFYIISILPVLARVNYQRNILFLASYILQFVSYSLSIIGLTIQSIIYSVCIELKPCLVSEKHPINTTMMSLYILSTILTLIFLAYMPFRYNNVEKR